MKKEHRINKPENGNSTPLHEATSPAMIKALLDRHADPALTTIWGYNVLMQQVRMWNNPCVRRLLQYQNVRAMINNQMLGEVGVDEDAGFTALHIAADRRLEPEYVDAALMELLLRGGADATIRDKQGGTALHLLISMEDAMEDVGEEAQNSYQAACNLLRQVPDAQTAALLVKARRLIVLAAINRPPAQAPDCLRVRTEQGKLWPRVEMVMNMAQGDESVGGRANDDHNEEQQQLEQEQERLHKALTFVLGLDGPGGKTLPAGVFVGVMDFLIPSWDPLRQRMEGLETEDAWDQTAMINALEEI